MPPQFTQNNPVPTASKKSHKKFWISAFVVIALMLGYLLTYGNWYINYYVFNKGMPPGYCDPGPCPIIEETKNWQKYSNGTWEITLPESWIGYKTEVVPMSSNFGAGEIAFRVPTNSKIWVEKDGYATAMRIYTFNPEYWDKIQKEEGPKPGFLGKNENWVYAYSFWQDTPDDWVNKPFTSEQIVSTFKFVSDNALNSPGSVVGILPSGSTFLQGEGADIPISWKVSEDPVDIKTYLRLLSQDGNEVLGTITNKEDCSSGGDASALPIATTYKWNGLITCANWQVHKVAPGNYKIGVQIYFRNEMIASGKSDLPFTIK